MRAILALLVLSACGGPNSVAGTVGSSPFEKARSAWYGTSIIVLVDEDVPCDQMGWVQRAYTDGAVVDGRRPFVAVQIAFRNDIEEGVFLADRIQGMTVDGIVNTSDNAEIHHAREGEITVDNISGGSISGSFFVAFADSGVAGAFDAKHCVNVR